MDNLFYAYGELHKLYLKKFLVRDLEAISVKNINRFTPRLMFPAFKIGILFEYFFINLSSFFENPVVPITTFFFCFTAILSISKVHFGTVKSIIIFAFLNALTELTSGLIPKIFFLNFSIFS